MAQILIDYIKQNGLDALEKKFAISVKRHGKYSNLVLLKYSQIESPMNEPIVQLCRGIILDEANDYKVVCQSFLKFFNHGESNAVKIDWTNAKIFTKEDGSLMQLFYYDNQWLVASSGSPDASGSVGGFEFNFSELFWRVWKELGYKLPNNTGYSYSLELLTPYNRVVVQHKQNRLVLIGCRRLSDLKEMNVCVEGPANGWEIPKMFPFTSFEEVIAASKELNPLCQEGYVITDRNYNRVKLKSETYVALSHLKDSVCKSKRQLLEIVRKNEGEEFLSVFGELKDDYYAVKSKYERLLGQAEGFYEAIKNESDRKKFASFAKTQKFGGLLFAMKDNKISSLKNGLAEMNIRDLERWLEIKSEEKNV